MKNVELSYSLIGLSFNTADSENSSDFHSYSVHDFGVFADKGD